MRDARFDISGYADPVAALSRALAARDVHAFRAALSAFDHVRDGELLTGVRRVAGELQTALQRFEVDSKLISLAQQQFPNARRRLAHVEKLTADGVHRTLDLVEPCIALADELSRDAEQLARRLAQGAAGTSAGADVSVFVRRVTDTMGSLHERLGEANLAQSYQDFVGQIIRSVMHLVDELERAVGELARIADLGGDSRRDGSDVPNHTGPVVPGIDHGNAVDGQQDVDALLSQLGM